MQRVRLLGPVFVILLCAFAHAQNGTLNLVDQFSSKGVQFKVSEYTENGQKAGVLTTNAGEQKVSAAFESSDWSRFADLWRKARQVDSPSWQMVGYYKEVGTKDPTLLIVVAGPSVRMILIETNEMSTFDLQPGDYDRFDRAVNEMTNFFAR